MAVEETVQKDVQNGQPASDEGKRDRSTIQFPYLPLEEAVSVAKGVHAVGGANCQMDQLAGHLQQPLGSSMFRLRLAAARIFGLVTYAHGTITLTALGTRICDPQQEQAARAEAFLAVPLYKQVYEQFKGGSLPPNNGLETAMASMGVAPKQKNNARQVFQRSATQAGFFAYGHNRLVYPPIKGSAGTAGGAAEVAAADGEKPVEKFGRTNGGDGGGSERHPLIEGLIKTLPEPSSPWPIEGRKKWLSAASNIFDLIYSTPDDSKGALRIEIQKDSAK
ncbi:MAG TPA: hypothetical protein VEU11_05950 [Terriglobales bacterium]|nr:hypothetical protein [Terriglobales bacterium]